MNPYSAPVALQTQSQQRPLPPGSGIPPPNHYHRGLPPAHEQPPHQIPAAQPHQSYYPDPRAPVMPPQAVHGSGPGIRDPVAGVTQREPGNGPPTIKSDPESEQPPQRHEPPPSISLSDETRTYTLVCEQQPQRARMCGFGDKDRRPITPPPCIQLIVTDKVTGHQINVNNIEHQMFVLSVDLWNADGTKEFNLVKHSQNSPSISSTTNSSFRDLEHAAHYPQSQYPMNIAQEPGSYAAQPPPHAYSSQVPGYPQQGHYTGYTGQSSGYGDYAFRPQIPQNMPQLPSQPAYGGRYPQDLTQARNNSLTTPQQANGMYTRNLIGSLVSSAARLTDPNDKVGIWFVLQDLSVRTEGWFRLRFSFTSVGIPNTQGDPHTSDPQKINQGKTPVLAQCYSEPFQVYSAKKFPGVCESTPLSRCFAHQGIKIPIRKEGQEGKGKNKGSDYEDDD